MELLHHSLPLVIQLHTFPSDHIHFLNAYKMFSTWLWIQSAYTFTVDLPYKVWILEENWGKRGLWLSKNKKNQMFLQMLEKMYMSANKQLSMILLAFEM